MPRRHRHCLLRALHTSLMLVLALCLAVQPLLAAVGEVHESTNHAATAGLHDDHAAPHRTVQAGDADRDRDDGTLHLLLHYAHCCGHNVAVAAAGLAALNVAPAGKQVLPPVMSHVASSRPNTPFRPPIRA